MQVIAHPIYCTVGIRRASLEPYVQHLRTMCLLGKACCERPPLLNTTLPTLRTSLLVQMPVTLMPRIPALYPVTLTYQRTHGLRMSYQILWFHQSVRCTASYDEEFAHVNCHAFGPRCVFDECPIFRRPRGTRTILQVAVSPCAPRRNNDGPAFLTRSHRVRHVPGATRTVEHSVGSSLQRSALARKNVQASHGVRAIQSAPPRAAFLAQAEGCPFPHLLTH